MPKRQPTYPALPAVVAGVLAPIRVVYFTPNVEQDQDDIVAYGHWSELTREIQINATLPPFHRWLAFYHEVMHAALSDQGLDEMYTDEALEALCDASATARMRERFG